MDDFGKRLRALMENENSISPLGRKVSQTELARHLGITRQAVSAYTLGTSVPDIIKFKAIADFFHVNYGYLLGEHNAKQETSDRLEKLKSEIEGHILEVKKLIIEFEKENAITHKEIR